MPMQYLGHNRLSGNRVSEFSVVQWSVDSCKTVISLVHLFITSSLLHLFNFHFRGCDYSDGIFAAGPGGQFAFCGFPAGMDQSAVQGRFAGHIAGQGGIGRRRIPRALPSRCLPPATRPALTTNSRSITAAQSRCTSRTAAPIWASLYPASDSWMKSTNRASRCSVAKSVIASLRAGDLAPAAAWAAAQQPGRRPVAVRRAIDRPVSAIAALNNVRKKMRMAKYIRCI